MFTDLECMKEILTDSIVVKDAFGLVLNVVAATEIPGAKVGKKIYDFQKSITSICERSRLLQAKYFYEKFHDGTLNQQKVNAYLDKIHRNEQKVKEEAEIVLRLLNDSIHEEQSKYLAQFFKAYIMGIVGRDVFFELIQANSKMFLSDYKLLFEVHDKCKAIENDFEKKYCPNGEEYSKESFVVEKRLEKSHAYSRLESLGLLRSRGYVEGWNGGLGHNGIRPTEFGELFCSQKIKHLI